MKAGLLLLMIMSAILVAGTTICAYEGATHDAIATLKDVKGYTVGLATFTEDAKWPGSHQRQRERPETGVARHPHS